MKLDIIILAAGQGKRMHSDLPKVLHLLAGKPLLAHVIDRAKELYPENIYVVYGYGGEKVRECFHQETGVTWVEQKERLGTGHAVLQVLPHLDEKHRALILVGDAPFISFQTLSDLIRSTKETELGLMTATLENPTGFGRILRDPRGVFTAIVEEKDAEQPIKAIQEINTGFGIIPVSCLKRWLPALKNHNEQREYYLTDLFALAVKEGKRVNTIQAKNETEVLGINDHVQLSYLERAYQKKNAEECLLRGLTLLDPNRFDVRGNLQFGKDVVVDCNVIVEGEVVIGSKCYIGPNVLLKNVKLGNGVRIEANSIVEEAEIQDDCVVGPFARVRPGTILRSKARVGNFVEVKKSDIGENSKVNHLTYLGDAHVGKNVNVGAGTITCNYDGVAKHKTTIEDEAFIGSNTALVAPVTIGKGATIGAGSTITNSAPPGKLTLARSRQMTVESWQRPQKKESSHE